jgi:very-short-patch-repair endonuclease
MARNRGSNRGEVLVAIMNNVRDWRIALEEGWYRVPIDSAPRRWPPDVVAFYKTKIFGEDAFSVKHFARVKEIQVAGRADLFPEEGSSGKSGRQYYRLWLETMEELPEPIPSLRLRRLVFIPTTMHKLETATEINDLFDDSPLEDAVWRELRRLCMPAERQYYVEHDGQWFSLDFAVFCREGKLNIETDGDVWHAEKSRIPEDNERNNALASKGWTVLRFNGLQVRERLNEYCVPQIVKTVNQLGGLSDEHGPPPTYLATKHEVVQQLRLFERRATYPMRDD